MPQCYVHTGSLGVDGALPLREYIKPWVDWAINGTGPPPHDTLAELGSRVADAAPLADNTDPATDRTDDGEGLEVDGDTGSGDGTVWAAAAHVRRLGLACWTGGTGYLRALTPVPCAGCT